MLDQNQQHVESLGREGNWHGITQQNSFFGVDSKWSKVVKVLLLLGHSAFRNSLRKNQRASKYISLALA